MYSADTSNPTCQILTLLLLYSPFIEVLNSHWEYPRLLSSRPTSNLCLFLRCLLLSPSPLWLRCSLPSANQILTVTTVFSLECKCNCVSLFNFFFYYSLQDNGPSSAWFSMPNHSLTPDVLLQLFSMYSLFLQTIKDTWKPVRTKHRCRKMDKCLIY